ncbi:MAG: long-chain fatty acid--CoA ligase [Desulfobulbaceae bacterium]|nr:MAG: long-chain fatty acid--CoA ligase [Desulfobulbaceae bacterium]
MTEPQPPLEPFAIPDYAVPATLFQVLVARAHRHRHKAAFIYLAGEEECQVTFGKLFEDVLLLSRAFRRRGIARGDRVVLLSDNRYDWIVTDLAIMAIGAVSVPRGADTPRQELEYIVEQSGSSYLVVETDQLLALHDDYIKGCRQLKGVFVISAPELHTLFSHVYSYADLLADRRFTDEDVGRFLRRGEEIMPDDLLTVIYTSGTTGQPKGVMLSHANIMHNVNEVPAVIGLTESDVWLSILPTWHIFERTAEYLSLARGSTLVYSAVKRFAQDLEKYRPTLVATVPRVWESLYSRVQAGVKKKGKLASRLFAAFVWISATFRRNRRLYLGRFPVYGPESWWQTQSRRFPALAKMVVLYPLHRLAMKKLALVQDRFGGRLRLAISGGGTLATYLEEWIDAVGIRIVNAYGMTECSPSIAGRGLNCRVYGTVGPPVPLTEIRIASEEGEILPPGREGLIEVRGPQVTRGYYRNEEETARSFTEDGFFRTGDLGRMTLTGELVITGRAKEIIVLASGENIDPTRIENAITMFPFIQDAVLVGQDKKGLGALLIPNIDELREYARQKFSDMKEEGEELLTNSRVLEHIKREMNRLLHPGQGFKPHEKLQGIAFLDREFKLGEELTNTLKKKRHVIEQKYRQIINDLLH